MTAFARLKFTFMALLFAGLILFMRAAHSLPAIPVAFKEAPVPVTIFCELESAFRDMKEAYEEGGEPQAQQLAKAYIASRQCHSLQKIIYFTPTRVMEKFPDDMGIVVEGVVEHVERGKITVYILISQEQLEMITKDQKA